MAQGEFILKVKIEGDTKGAKLVSAEVDRAAGSQKRLTGATNSAAEAQEGQNKTMRDGVRGTANSTKSFSKLAETVGGGLVGAYAALAANIFAVSAAFNALRGAQQAQMVLEGLEVQGARTGRTLTLAAQGLREIVKFGIDSQTAMQSTAQFTAAGFSIDELERLGSVASNTSLALGRNLTDSMERLIRGTVKLEPELLDELGIMTKIGEATRVYALQNNKTEASLTSFERRQAFLNAVLAEGEAKFGGIADSIDANPYDKLAASFSDLTKNFLNFINNTLGVGGIVEFLADNTLALTGAIVLFGSSIKGQVLGSLTELNKRTADSAKAQQIATKAIADKTRAHMQEAQAAQAAARAEAANMQIHEKSAPKIRLQTKAIREMSLSVEQLDAAIKTNNRSVAAHTGLLKKGKDTLDDGSSRQELVDALTRQSAALEKQKTVINDFNAAQAKEASLRSQRIAVIKSEYNVRALNARADAVDLATQGKLIQSYQALSRSTRQYALSLSYANLELKELAATGGIAAVANYRLAQSLAALKVAGFAAKTAIMTVGTALLSFMGYIGGVMIAYELLKGAYEYLYKSLYPETYKAQEELNTVMEDYQEILTTATRTAEEYVRIMNSQASLSSRIINANTAVANSIVEIVDQYNEAIAAVDALAAAREEDARNAARSSSGTFFTTLAASEMSRAGNYEESARIMGDLRNAQEELAQSLESRLFKNISDGGEEVEATRALIQGLETQLGEGGLQRALNKAGISVDDFAQEDLRELGVVANAIRADADKLRQALENLGNAFKEGEEKSTQFIQSLIPRTGYDDIISNYRDINNAILDLQETMQSDLINTNQIAGALTGIGPDASTFLDSSAQETLRMLNEQATLYQTQKDNMEDLSLVEQDRVLAAQEILNNSGQYLDDLRNSFVQAEAMLSNMRAQVALAGAQASLEQARLSKFSAYLQIGAAGLRARIQSEERIRALQVVAIQAEKAIVDAKIAQKEAAISRMRQEREDLQNQLTRLQRESSMTEQLVMQLSVWEAIRRSRQAAANAEAIDPATAFGATANSLLQDQRRETREQREARALRENQRRQAEAQAGITAVTRAIDNAERELDSMRLASQVLGTQIAATLFENLGAAAKAAKYALEDAQVFYEVARRQNEQAEANLARDISFARYEAVRDGTQDELSVRLRALDVEALARANILTREADARKALLEAQIADANAMLGESASEAQRQGIRATIDDLRDQLLTHNLISEAQIRNNANEYHTNYLLALGLSTLKERLELEKEYTEQALRLLEVEQKAVEARMEYNRQVRNAPATMLGVEVPGDTIRIMEEQHAFLIRQNAIERERIDLEYQLLEAQYVLERARMRTIASDSKATDEMKSAANSAIEAYDRMLGSGVGRGDTIFQGGGTLENARVAARATLDTEQEASAFAISEARTKQHVDVILEQFAKLGPEGEAMSALFSGITQMTFAIDEVFKTFENGNATTLDKINSVSSALTAALSTISSVVAATTDAKIANIDREIAAEQKRDGKSAESVAKLDALEKKKDAIARKAFNTNKKIMMAQAVISTAAGVANALATPAPFPIPMIMAGIIGAMGAAQLAIIAGSSYQSASPSSSAASSPSTLSIGRRDNRVDLARGPNPNAGGEEGYIRGAQGYGNNASNYNTIGSAYGGNLTRGYGKSGFVVGEKGPEVISPDVPLSVTPADQVGGGQSINASFSINAIDSAGVEKLLLSQRGNIITMLREAANANGETFLEDVNTNVYTSPSVGKLI